MISRIAFTLDPDAVAVRDLLRDREAEPAAALILLGALFIKPVEDIGDLFRQYSAATVRNGNDPFLPSEIHFHRHAALRRGKFYGIVKDDHKHLPQTPVVPNEENVSGFIFQLDPDLLLLRDPLHGADRFFHDIGQVQLRLFDLEIGILEPGKLQQVVHQPLQMRRV